MKALLAPLFLLAGCVAPIAPPLPDAPDPYAADREAAAAGAPVYRIDPQPMSVLGGALAVQDEMELSFRIHASRVR